MRSKFFSLIYVTTILIAFSTMSFAGEDLISSKNLQQSCLAQLTGAEITQRIRLMNAENEIVSFSPRLNIPMVVNGLNKPRAAQTQTNIRKVKDSRRRQVTVVGAGLAGLTAALELTRKGYSVLLLEEGSKVGGLASGSKRAGDQYDNGTAYFASLIPEQEPIFKVLGLSQFERTAKINSPSDSLFIADGIRTTSGKVQKYFPDFWEHDEVLHELPASFELTRWAHRKLSKENLIPNQPFEDANSKFDKMDYESFLHSQFTMLNEHIEKNPTDAEAVSLFNKIQVQIKSGRLNTAMTGNNKGIMDPVIRYYMNNYCHSALGGFPNKTNAAAAINFVFSEMETRYTYPLGTGEIAQRTRKYIEKSPELATISVSSKVISVVETADGVLTTYIQDGKIIEVRPEHLVYAAPVTTAIDTIRNIDKLSPEHAKIIKSMKSNSQITDYVVIPVFIKGHPAIVKATYDMWLGRQNFTSDLPTDFISGEWAKYDGYTLSPRENDPVSSVTIYHPFGKTAEMTREQLIAMAEKDISYMLSLYNPIQVENGEQPIEVLFAEVNFWQQSILRPAPGHFAQAQILRKPIGQRIRLAQSGLGTPSNEEAQYRGWRAAQEIEAILGEP